MSCASMICTERRLFFSADKWGNVWQYDGRSTVLKEEGEVITSIRAQRLARATRHYYNELAGQFAAVEKSVWIDAPLRKFLSMLPVDPLVVDLGCGTGRGIRLLQQNGIRRFIGVDNAKGMLHIAKTRYPDVDFRLGDLHDDLKLVVSEEQCDGFFCTEVLMHIPRQRMGEVLKHIRSVLKVGAVGHISLPCGTKTLVLDSKNTSHVPKHHEVLSEQWTFEHLAPHLALARFTVPHPVVYEGHMMRLNVVAM